MRHGRQQNEGGRAAHPPACQQIDLHDSSKRGRPHNTYGRSVGIVEGNEMIKNDDNDRHGWSLQRRGGLAGRSTPYLQTK